MTRWAQQAKPESMTGVVIIQPALVVSCYNRLRKQVGLQVKRTKSRRVCKNGSISEGSIHSYIQHNCTELQTSPLYLLINPPFASHTNFTKEIGCGARLTLLP